MAESSEPTFTPQSTMILDSGVDRSMQDLPTSLHPPRVEILTHWSLETTSLCIFLPTVLRIFFLSAWTDLK